MATTRLAAILIVAIIIAVASGTVLGYYVSLNSTTVTITPSMPVNSQTGTQTLVVMRTTTQTSSVTESYSTTITVVRAVQAETITELLIAKSAVEGENFVCGGNLSAGTCIGTCCLEFYLTTTTSYIFPSDQGNGYFNATITTLTTSASLSCGSVTTTTTVTLSYNSTSGIGSESISWTRSCS